jgi:hypothetical protein
MALVMAPVVSITQNQMCMVKVVWKCCVAHIMRKLPPHRQLLVQLPAAKQRKQQKKLRSEQWRFEMVMAG